MRSIYVIFVYVLFCLSRVLGSKASSTAVARVGV